MATTELIVFPEINPLPMMQKDGGQFFADTIPAHEEQVSFCQKAQISDTFYIVFVLPSDTIYTAMTAGIYDCDGALAWILSPEIIVQGVSTHYDFYKMAIPFADVTAEALYTVRLSINETDPGARPGYTFESEPIYVRTTWPATVLLKYANDVNDFDIPFEDMEDFYFYTRIEGGFPSPGFKPDSKDQIFIDQNHMPTLLDSIPFNIRQMQFGAAVGIANWQANVINRSLSCAFWYSDGLRYCKNQGAKLEATHSTHYPLSGYTIDLIGLTEYPDTAFTYSRIFVLGGGDMAIRAGDGYTMFKAKTTA